jgi:glycyl-tRNA synthetase beta chain
MPEGLPGLIAGLLDRLDTLAGYFGIGIRPKGTSDPYGLRRNALGLLAVIQHAKLDIDLETFARAAIANYGDLVANPDTALNALLGFIESRLETMARDQEYAHDYVAAALAVHYRKPNQLFACLEALNRLDAGTVQALAEQAKRMQRIIKDPAEDVAESLLTDAEKPLFDLCTRDDSRLRELVARHDFEAAFAEVLGWVPVVHAYFEEVLVNDEDDAVRQNRHAMLRDVLRDITAPADFTKIEKREA